MPNTYINTTIDSGASQKEIQITFPFLNKTDVKVKSLRTLPLPAQTNVLNWTYYDEDTFNSYIVNGETTLPFGSYTIVFENGVNKVKFSPAVPINSSNNLIQTGYSITIFRQTSNNNNLQFTNGSPIQSSDLNYLLLLLTYSNEENNEAINLLSPFDYSTSLNNKFDKTGGNITGGINVSGSGNFGSSVSCGALTPSSVLLPSDLSGTIRNVPIPAYPNDAVNKSYVDALSLPGTPITINDDSVTAEKLRKVAGEQAVTTATIRDSAVTNSKLNNSSVTSTKIATSAIATQNIADNAITGVKIADNNINEAHLVSNCVSSSKLQNNSVTTDKISNNAITTSKIASGAVTADKLALGQISGETLIDNTITSRKLQTSGISWASNQPTSANPVALTQNGEVTITNGNIDANSSDLKIKDLTRFPSSFVQAQAIANNDEIILEENAIFPTNNLFNFWTLQNYDNQPLVFRANVDGVTRKEGYLNFNIAVKSKLSSNIFGTTIIQLLRPLVSTSGRAGASYANNVINYKTISDIPFQKILTINGNPHISLNPATGSIIFGSIPEPARYLIRVSGAARSTRATGGLTIVPPTDKKPGTNIPLSVETVTFDSGQVSHFTISSILSLGANDPITTSVQYYYTDSSATAPLAGDVSWVEAGQWHGISGPFGSYLPSEWYNSWIEISSNGQSVVVINDPRVECVIQRVPL